MIEWKCDSCGSKIEHQAADPPLGWATVSANITWCNGGGDSYSELISEHIVLCPACRTGSKNALEAKAVSVLRQGFSQVSDKQSQRERLTDLE